LKPIYFPFTYVPQWVAETLTACFKQFIVYQPSGKKLPDGMGSWAEKNIMDVCVPVQSEDEKLAKMTKDFQAFASLYGESKYLKTAAFLGQQCGVPFFDESAASRIISELKKGGKPEPAQANLDPLFCARVFLDFAQEFDRQSDELNQGLEANDQHSLDLLNLIGSETSRALPVTPLTTEIKVEDPGEYMVPGRLQAWSRLFMKDPADSGLLITSSKTVFHHLIDNQTSAEKIIKLDGLPAIDDGATTWRDLLIKQTKELIENRWTSDGRGLIGMPRPEGRRSNIALTFYLVPGQSPTDLFHGIFQDQNVDTTKRKKQAGFTNTVLGLIDQRSEKPFQSI
jgi:hypothetical protein